MPNYFFNDADGSKQGPITVKQLQMLINRGIISPTTPLETDSGHTGLAGQIPGLKFDTAVPPPVAQAAPKRSEQTTYSPPRQSTAHSQTNESTGRPWLTDFAFQDVQLLENGRRICSFIYRCCVFTLVINGLLGFFMLNPMYSADAMTAAIIFLVIYLLFAYVVLALVRIACEFLIVLLDYINQRSH